MSESQLQSGLSSLSEEPGRFSNDRRRPAGKTEALAGPGVAIFDFDCTLTERDTLLPWLAALRGWRRTLAVAARVGLAEPFRLSVPEAMGSGGMRSRTKAAMLSRLVAGVPLNEARAAALALEGVIDWRSDVARYVDAHREAGHRIVVATGSPLLYVADLVRRRFGIEDVLATELESRDGRLTGRLASANCVRAEKARRVAAWLEANDPIGTSWGYGNAPHDLPMMALLDHSTFV